MKQFRYELNKTFAKGAEFKVYHFGEYIGTITVWTDGKVFYSADSVIENLGIIRYAAEQYANLT